jgi:hypothetical protein
VNIEVSRDGHIDLAEELPDSDPRSIAVDLATLADSFGGMRMMVGEDPRSLVGGDALLRWWRWRRPTDWPHDRVDTLADRGVRVTVTVLTFPMQEPAGQWVPRAYSFVLRPEGELLSWDVREAAPFPTPYEMRQAEDALRFPENVFRQLGHGAQVERVAVLIKRYREAYGSLPPSLDELVTSGIRFGPSAPEISWTLVMWGKPIRCLQVGSGYELRAAGPDGEFDSPDDFVVVDPPTVR